MDYPEQETAASDSDIWGNLNKVSTTSRCLSLCKQNISLKVPKVHLASVPQANQVGSSTQPLNFKNLVKIAEVKLGHWN